MRAGAHRVAATFIQEFEGTEDDLIQPIDHTLADTQIGVGYGVTTLPHLRNLAIAGPFAVTGISDTPTRRAIFICRPTSAAEARPRVFRSLSFDDQATLRPGESLERFLVFRAPEEAGMLTLTLEEVWLGAESFDLQFPFEAFSGK